ncbi:50S ribosome-binding GTPase [Candidatus Woesearchaeota archaeon]|nr:50S ribosome-binding GTPase [Candidatus Woesearchaeota archaeon]
MPSYWRHVNLVLKESEIVIEVLDARHINETRNVEIEKKIEKYGKKILYVINKCDLVKKQDLEAAKKKLKPSIFISSKDHLGTTMLKHKILELSKGKNTTVGVVGYPNVGKSSLINALAGRGKARTSSESGFTKGVQKVRVDAKIVVLDTPGVFPDMEKNTEKFGKTGAVDYSKIKDPEISALKLIEEKKEVLQKHFDIHENDEEEFLEKLALKFKKMSKGGSPDIEAAARLLLKAWQTGKVKQ